MGEYSTRWRKVAFAIGLTLGVVVPHRESLVAPFSAAAADSRVVFASAQTERLPLASLVASVVALSALPVHEFTAIAVRGSWPGSVANTTLDRRSPVLHGNVRLLGL